MTEQVSPKPTQLTGSTSEQSVYNPVNQSKITRTYAALRTRLISRLSATLDHSFVPATINSIPEQSPVSAPGSIFEGEETGLWSTHQQLKSVLTKFQECAAEGLDSGIKYRQSIDFLDDFLQGFLAVSQVSKSFPKDNSIYPNENIGVNQTMGNAMTDDDDDWDFGGVDVDEEDSKLGGADVDGKDTSVSEVDVNRQKANEEEVEEEETEKDIVIRTIKELVILCQSETLGKPIDDFVTEHHLVSQLEAIENAVIQGEKATGMVMNQLTGSMAWNLTDSESESSSNSVSTISVQMNVKDNCDVKGFREVNESVGGRLKRSRESDEVDSAVVNADFEKLQISDFDHGIAFGMTGKTGTDIRKRFRMK
ncbi:hypothetical protein M231_00982 [Tremella mesenterica]|uniref:Uncharacterized protein n=1 Tax=Tremella mesenterica TaxID=5217 RepID=A0A4V1M4W1_TREME|nr:uncharacterized protein TREMEDRAFT_61615 [Tremella mesenterica DSM 1558]EIW69845.1 hypothetical protein TREMEDRAFT_61615 [Tremella mesenterica DSM 1558]RXK41747.1 hypothetical protein M231_00982 [Tremella mesenterica]